MFRLLLLFTLLQASLIINSQEATSQQERKFENVVVLSGEKVKIPETLFIPTAIYTVDDKLLVIDDGGDYYFHLYSYPKIENIELFGRKGEGPDEIKFNPQLSFMDKQFIDFFDFRNNSLFEINTGCRNNNGNNNKCIRLLQVLPTELTNPQNVIKIDDTIIAGFGVNGGKIFFYNTKTKQPKFISLPFETFNIKEQDKNIIYNGYMACSSDKSFIVFASLYFDCYMMFDNNGNILLNNYKREISNLFFSKGRVTTDNTKLYYTSVFATEKYFYLLYVGGRSTNELMREIDNNTFKCEIQKYSQNGLPVSAYIINKPVTSFCVSEEFKDIITIDPASEDAPIVRFGYK